MAETLNSIVRALSEYIDVKVLSDGSVAAIGDMLTTRVIYIDCRDLRWSHRFCFADREVADRKFRAMKSKDDLTETAVTT